MGDWARIVVRAAARTIPSRAERARTVLAACTMPEIVAHGVHETVDIHGVDPTGRLILVVGEHSTPADLVAGSPGSVPIVLEAAQLRPLHVPDRVRARVEVHGWLDAVPATEHTTVMLQLGHVNGLPLDAAPPAGCTVLRAEPGHVELDGADVELEEFRRAVPDPFAHNEGELIHHLRTGHGEMLTILYTLLDPGLIEAAIEITPSGLDRYGLTFRVRDAQSTRETRLPFPAPLDYPEALPDALHQLLWRAQQAS